MLLWDKKYSVGVKEIDSQHGKMIDYINELENAMHAEDTRETIVKVLNGLVTYTKEHFETEEKYFRQFDYEDTEAHISEHMNLISDVDKLIYKFAIGEELSLASILKFLENWLLEHILDSDKKYMACFQSNGLS